MALVLSSEYSASNTSGDCTIILVDDGTGDYDAVTNTGGWGAPNPERSEVLATGSVQLTAGTAGSVSGITVNGIEVMSGAEVFVDTLDNLATAIAANITANTSSPNYTATAVTDTVTITATANSGDSNEGFVVTASVTGDVTTTDTNMSGGAFGMALYNVLTKKSVGDDTDIVDDTNDSIATAATQFTLDTEGDGWYISYLIAFPTYDLDQAYAVNQIIYFNGSLYQCTVTTVAGEDPISASGKWSAFASTAANLRLVLDSVAVYSPTSTIYTSDDDIFETCAADKIYADAWEDQSSGCSECYQLQDAIDITTFLEGAKIAFARNQYETADKKVQVVNDYGDGSKCVDC